MRVLLIGSGPLPGPGTRHVGFAQLRLQAFDHQLGQAGHQVLRVELTESAGWFQRLESLGSDCEVVVSAGPYGPGRAAALVAGDRPLWADLPGDPFAELHAQSLHGMPSQERRTAALEHALAVLDRADAISVVSHRQRLATLGQLGSRGRMLGEGAAEMVHTLPITWSFPGQPGAPRTRTPDEALRVVMMGALNAWFDEATAMAGLEQALALDRRIEVHICGGPHPAHPATSWRSLERWAANHPGQVKLHGWLPGDQLDALLQDAHVGLSLDRPGVEPLLGSRTRILGFLWAGLPVVTTPATELSQLLARGSHLETVPQGDAQALCEALLARADRVEDGAQVRGAQRFASQHFAPDRVLAPLLDWLAHPTRVNPSPAPEALLLEELARARDALAQVHASATWRLLSRLHRRIRGS